MDKDKISERFNELIEEGDKITRCIPIGTYEQFAGKKTFYMSEDDTVKCQQWISSVTNLLHIIKRLNEYYSEECNKICADKNLARCIPVHGYRGR